MVFSLKNFSNASPAKAEVIDGYLILSLPHAKTPIVWRMALENIGTASFEVKLDSKDGDISQLVLSPKTGNQEIIASFAEKQDALDALMIASNALHSSKFSKGFISESSSSRHNSRADKHNNDNVKKATNLSEGQKWVLAILAALIVIGLYYYLTTLIPYKIEDGNSASQSTGAAAPDKAGVPLSADEFLNGL